MGLCWEALDWAKSQPCGGTATAHFCQNRFHANRQCRRFASVWGGRPTWPGICVGAFVIVACLARPPAPNVVVGGGNSARVNAKSLRCWRGVGQWWRQPLQRHATRTGLAFTGRVVSMGQSTEAGPRAFRRAVGQIGSKAEPLFVNIWRCEVSCHSAFAASSPPQLAFCRARVSVASELTDQCICGARAAVCLCV